MENWQDFLRKKDLGMHKAKVGRLMGLGEKDKVQERVCSDLYRFIRRQKLETASDLTFFRRKTYKKHLIAAFSCRPTAASSVASSAVCPFRPFSVLRFSSAAFHAKLCQI